MKLALLNTAIITADGDFSLRTISVEKARELIAEAEGLDSAIGHEATAQIMTELLGIEVPVNRQMFVQKPGQKALVFKLNGRPPEGKILSKDEIEQIGFKFQLLEMNEKIEGDSVYRVRVYASDRDREAVVSFRDCRAKIEGNMYESDDYYRNMIDFLMMRGSDYDKVLLYYYESTDGYGGRSPHLLAEIDPSQYFIRQPAMRHIRVTIDRV